MIVLTKDDVPYAIKVNADEFFRKLNENKTWNPEHEYKGPAPDDDCEVTAVVDLSQDDVRFNNEERTVVITPQDVPVEDWLFYADDNRM